MAEHHHNQHKQTHDLGDDQVMKGSMQEWCPSGSQVLSIAALLPIGGTLLALSVITLTLTVIGLALAVPVFVIFSPVLAPAAILIGLAVTGFLASGAFGLTELTSLSWIFSYLRGVKEEVPEELEQWKRRMAADTATRGGQRSKEVGERIQSKAHEVRTT